MYWKIRDALFRISTNRKNVRWTYANNEKSKVEKRRIFRSVLERIKEDNTYIVGMYVWVSSINLLTYDRIERMHIAMIFNSKYDIYYLNRF